MANVPLPPTVDRPFNRSEDSVGSFSAAVRVFARKGYHTCRVGASRRRQVLRTACCTTFRSKEELLGRSSARRADVLVRCAPSRGDEARATSRWHHESLRAWRRVPISCVLVRGVTRLISGTHRGDRRGVRRPRADHRERTARGRVRSDSTPAWRAASSTARSKRSRTGCARPARGRRRAIARAGRRWSKSCGGPPPIAKSPILTP